MSDRARGRRGGHGGGVLHLDDEAVAAGVTLITGASFGIVAAEAAVVALCRDHPAPVSVRTETVPSLATEGGVVGEALAASLVDGLPEGGRRYRGGRLVRTRLGSDAAEVTLPDGDRVTTLGAGWPGSGSRRSRCPHGRVPASTRGRAPLARWPDGGRREQWLRLGDASTFTSTAAAVVAHRLAAGAAWPGADTPVGSLGLDLVEEAGGTLLD
jgi:hypothetical protein